MKFIQRHDLAVPNTYRSSMACVAHNSVLEVIDDVSGYMNVSSVFVQDAKIGDVVRDPISLVYSRITSIDRQHTGDVWPLFSYMGLHADAAQWVHDMSRGWTPIVNVGVPCVTSCPAIYSLALDNSRVLRIGGVTCCTIDQISLSPSPCPFPEFFSSSSLSDDS